MKFVKIWPLFLGLGVFFLDQVFKWWFEKNSSLVIKNSGLFFGYIRNLDLFFWIILIIIVLILFVANRSWQKWNLAALSLIFAGAISNIYDKIFKSGIIDYIQMKNIVFNLADVSIMAGVVIYAYQISRNK